MSNQERNDPCLENPRSGAVRIAALKAFKKLNPDYQQRGKKINWNRAYEYLKGQGLVD